MLRTAELQYDLPEELIATEPARPRDSARLMVVSRSDEGRIEHRRVRELDQVLRSGDLMVVNATRVLAARFKGVRVDSGGGVEGLYVGPAGEAGEAASTGSPAAEAQGTSTIKGAGQPVARAVARWIVLLKMRRQKAGVQVRLLDRAGRTSDVSLRLIERADDEHAEGEAESGGWVVEVDVGGEPLAAGAAIGTVSERVGLTPLPPYILSARKKGHIEVDDARDRDAYQTVYANERGERPGMGSVAAPTAGLHFTPELFERLRARGVERAEVTLDVGLGTFKPVETEFVEQHPMHTEWCAVPLETAGAIGAARARGGRVVAVGTTAARTLESFSSPDEMERVGARETRILITPGYTFKHVDVLMTNFHLPGSTLMAMVAAFLARPGEDAAASVGRLKRLYAEAMREGYRFYSYGDAMIVMP